MHFIPSLEDSYLHSFNSLSAFVSWHLQAFHLLPSLLLPGGPMSDIPLVTRGVPGEGRFQPEDDTFVFGPVGFHMFRACMYARGLNTLEEELSKCE